MNTYCQTKIYPKYYVGNHLDNKNDSTTSNGICIRLLLSSTTAVVA